VWFAVTLICNFLFITCLLITMCLCRLSDGPTSVFGSPRASFPPVVAAGPSLSSLAGATTASQQQLVGPNQAILQQLSGTEVRVAHAD